MDRGTWWAAVYGVAQSRTRLKRLSSSSCVERWFDPDPSSKATLWVKAQHEGALPPPVHRPQRPAGSTHSSTRGLRPPEQLERPAGFRGPSPLP